MGSPLSDESTIDHVLKYCQRHRIHTVDDGELPADCKRGGPGEQTVRIGNIVFRCNGHSTGNDVRGWIVDGNDAYEFVSTTFWFSSQYTFNTSKWESGAWDAAVDSFFKTLKEAKAKHEAEVLAVQEHAADQRKRSAAEHKARFERQFARNNS
jgi:hypothetical protein